MDLEFYNRVLRKAGVEFQPGPSEDEIQKIQAAHSFLFPPDLKEFLMFALPRLNSVTSLPISPKASGWYAGFAIASDAQGKIYVTGQTNSANLPVANALPPSYGRAFSDVFAPKLKIGPVITRAQIMGKRSAGLRDRLRSRSEGPLNGNPQKTANDGQSPAMTRVGRKAGKLMSPGQTVALQVQNSDCSLSNQFSFTRPSS